ncbi:MAG TPA: hypothetical protein PKA28_01300 [Methylomusa anaerophila]|uniref:Uncharacterized protein n=1 Tax=Methylomusa anaerophila TaxID=1930071 RepID=A0A348APV2_9FIRM|nr:hypothetical protein [Methylomusa anaerophila]BBB93100.1 hypothetical protein MAMMFC1_03809 [Methylomusa anaerophila]HML87067.1 hypothetical protein [Methylomusa anaerophila]
MYVQALTTLLNLNEKWDYLSDQEKRVTLEIAIEELNQFILDYDCTATGNAPVKSEE